MDFGLMTQIQIPRPWTETSERQAYWNAIDQAVLGEEMGFGYFWITEQHFLAEIGHAPASDMFLAAVSQRTKTIRMGLGVVLLPLHNPFYVAERVGVLDVLSNGRVEFGSGTGTSTYILEGLGIDPAMSKPVGAEAIQAILKMWDSPRFPGFKGEIFDLPPREVLPRPIQAPHPPCWTAATNFATYEFAASRGFGVIGVTRNSVEETRQAVDHYRQVFASTSGGEKLARVPNNRCAVFGIGYCGEDDAEAKRIGCAAARWYYGDNDAELNPLRFTSVKGGVAAIREKISGFSDDDLIENGMAIAGNPDTICRIVEKWQSTGIDQFIFFIQAGFTTHDQVMRSIELIGEKVIPRFGN